MRELLECLPPISPSRRNPFGGNKVCSNVSHSTGGLGQAQAVVSQDVLQTIYSSLIQHFFTTVRLSREI